MTLFVARAHRLRGCGHHRARRGITVIEILVAIMLLSIGLVGVMGSSGAVAASMGGGMRQTVAAGLAQSRLDSLASLSCAQLTDGLVGSSTTRGVQEAWLVTDGRNTKTLKVTLTIPKKVQRPVYTTVIPCRD